MIKSQLRHCEITGSLQEGGGHARKGDCPRRNLILIPSQEGQGWVLSLQGGRAPPPDIRLKAAPPDGRGRPSHKDSTWMDRIYRIYGSSPRAFASLILSILSIHVQIRSWTLNVDCSMFVLPLSSREQEACPLSLCRMGFARDPFPRETRCLSIVGPA